MSDEKKKVVVVIGGGPGGLGLMTLAAKALRNKVTVIQPDDILPKTKNSQDHIRMDFDNDLVNNLKIQDSLQRSTKQMIRNSRSGKFGFNHKSKK